MADFPDIALGKPVYGTTETRTTGYRTTRYGGGFEVRTAFGLNQAPRNLAVTYQLDEAKCKIMEEWIESTVVLGLSFKYKPHDGEDGMYVCDTYTKTQNHPVYKSYQLNLRQVFEKLPN